MMKCEFLKKKNCFTAEVNRENCISCTAVSSIFIMLRTSLKNPALAGRMFDDLKENVDLLEKVYVEYGNVEGIEEAKKVGKFLVAGRRRNFRETQKILKGLKERLGVKGEH